MKLKPEPPFTLGVDFAGTVVEPGSSGLAVGQRVAGVGGWGGAAELVANPAAFTFPLPDVLSYDEGAALLDRELRSRRDGAAFVVATHDPERMEGLASMRLALA